MKKIHLSVAGILKFENQFLLIKRKKNLVAYGGYWAFPGGKIDQQDYLDDALNKLNVFKDQKSLNNQNILSLPYLLSGLQRELLEEIHFDLIKGYEKGQINSITQVLDATSPAFNPIRYQTIFFLIDLKEKFFLNYFDPGEIELVQWFTAREFLTYFQRGDVLCIPPIRDLLLRFATNQFDFHLLNHPDENFIFNSQFNSEVTQVVIPSNTLPPFNTTNAFIVGENEVFLIDPAAKDEIGLNYLIKIIDEYKVKHILITHHHSDHHTYIDVLQKKISGKIYLHRQTYDRIKNNYQIEINHFHFLQGGEVISTHNQNEIGVLHIPGHAPGHIAIYSLKLKWMIVSDLFQGKGSVVIGESGDITEYLNSLQTVIKMNPDIIYPSHGMPMGSVEILKRNYEHRLFREQQIILCLQRRLTLDEIFENIYFDTPISLKIYASKNIQSHLRRIKFLFSSDLNLPASYWSSLEK